MTTETIDLTPTWGEIGTLYTRLVASGELNALQKMRPEIARAFAAAEALKLIQATLTEGQKKVVAKTLTEELAKQGY
ncbi:hypothetical protein [Burkholderia cenocepacia]|uniref:hypothetical protein n=1 Tax=Burkholderia cenocepacia TaxID=95486 RepID=UPI002ABE9897|nr:hypothetical protein [Burkholderia cenocepacia]